MTLEYSKHGLETFNIFLSLFPNLYELMLVIVNALVVTQPPGW